VSVCVCERERPTRGPGTSGIITTKQQKKIQTEDLEPVTSNGSGGVPWTPGGVEISSLSASASSAGDMVSCGYRLGVWMTRR
jgi:hypothetical protein